MIDHVLTLNYRLQPGWMAQFTDALQRGQAMALRCTGCQKVSFPPVRTCDCGETRQDWTKLAGTADIQYRCDGLDGDFALVRFHGADTMSVVRLEGFEQVLNESGMPCGELRPLTGTLPALVLHPTSDALIDG
jgi:hypothetical protein